MNKSKYKLSIFYNDIYKPTIIRFNEYTKQNNLTNIINSNIIDFNNIIFCIITDPKPMLTLYCNEYNFQTELYEYAINYIIDNKIAKYSELKFTKYGNTKQNYIIVAHFDIIDTNILLQLL